MITLISTPAYTDPLDPAVICRWLATESPNNFRLLRRDWIVTGANAGGYLQVISTDDYTGSAGDDISVYCNATDQMYIGKVTNVDGTLRIITTDIVWVAGMDIVYLNDNTLHGGYYFEGRLTVNGVLYPLTINASPDSFGYADVDVSGVLRIVTALGKAGDYSQRVMKESTKSGNFSFEYRECWYGSNESWTQAQGVGSPESVITWYYAELIRSEEQGSNLHDYVTDVLNDSPFLNQFDQPVYFLGLPFDLSFILPELALTSPSGDLTVNTKIYDSNNILLSSMTELIDPSALQGYVCSITIDPATIPAGAAYFTLEILI